LASDDVLMASVQVTILDEAGNAVEKGRALRDENDWWEYVPAVTGTVVVEVKDLVGIR
jgi:hypothetical protein